MALTYCSLAGVACICDVSLPSAPPSCIASVLVRTRQLGIGGIWPDES